MDKLFINGLRLRMRVGCTPRERAVSQPIVVDMEMAVPLRVDGINENLQKTVNYAEVVERIKDRVEPKRYKLVETVAEAVAETVLNGFRVSKITVRVKKMALPSIESFVVEIKR